MFKTKAKQVISESKNKEAREQKKPEAETLSDDKLGQVSGGTMLSVNGMGLENEKTMCGINTGDLRGTHLA